MGGARKRESSSRPWPSGVRIIAIDALIAQSHDTSGAFSCDHGPSFELEAELAKEINRCSEVIDDDSYVVHPFERHRSSGFHLLQHQVRRFVDGLVVRYRESKGVQVETVNKASPRPSMTGAIAKCRESTNPASRY
jgi:hypothetical protein